MTRNSITYITALLAVVTLSSSSIVNPVDKSGNFELLILHNNDMHARFEQTSQLSGACTVVDREAGKCYGGFPRVAHVVKEARKAAALGQGPPVLYLNAGDTYTGTAWFTIYKWKIAAEFINALEPDAVCLGNHEFDENVNGLVPFIHNLSSPVLAANLILDEAPELKNETNLYNSIIITKNNVQIGIIGYLTPETKLLAPFNKVNYEDEILALRREVKELKTKGVNIIIALGHSGYLKDMEIARDVEDIDLVIGGHSNTFLLNNNTTDEIPEVPQGPYPEVVEQSSDRKVLVVQAYAYTKYLGKLHLTFNSVGEVIEYDGEPILLNQSIPKDPQVLELVNKYRDEIDLVNGKVVGSSLVFLNAEKCRIRECNMGNFITDAILDYMQDHENFSDVSISVVQGGRIRASIERAEKPFQITRGDVAIVLPYTDSLTILTMNGSVLLQTLEHSVAGWRTIDSVGQFLQISGMEVTYDLDKPPGSRVANVKAKCSNCADPTFAPIEDNLEYKLTMPIFLADGGDGYVIFTKLPRNDLPYSEVTCVLNYLSKYSPISTGLSSRITLLNEDKVKKLSTTVSFARKQGKNLGSNAKNNSLPMFSNILIFVLVLSQCL